MKKTRSFITLIVAVCLLLSGAFVPATSNTFVAIGATAAETTGEFEVTLDVQMCYDYALEVLAIVNETRAAVGKQPLEIDAELTEIAMQRAADTVVSFGHTRPNGDSCFSIFPRSGSSGENIACSYTDPQSVMTGWINSPVHYQNIIDASFKTIGIGCVQAENGIFYWAQAFNANKAAGTVSAVRQNKTFTVPVVCAYADVAFSCPDQLKSGKSGKAGVWASAQSYFAVELYDFVFSSSNPAVATVDAQGNITALSAGTTIIRATAKTNASVVFEQELTVTGTTAHTHTMRVRQVIRSADGQYFSVQQQCTSCGQSSQSGPYMNGDADFSGDCSAADARTVLRISVYLESVQPQSAMFYACDANNDGMITAGDARSILRASVGLEQILIY